MEIDNSNTDEGASVPNEEVKSPTVDLDRPVIVEAKNWNDDAITIAIPNQTLAETEALVRSMPNEDYDKSKEGRLLQEALVRANYSIPYNGMYSTIFNREGSLWKQNVKSENGDLTDVVPKIKAKAGQKLTGEAALMKARALMGMGSQFKIGLWHTGCWITLKAPEAAARVELNRRLTEEKIRLGRQTHGMAFSNNSVFFASTLAEFAIAHIYEHNIADMGNKSWEDIIKSPDLPILVWGMAYVIWPKGFQMLRSILDPEAGSFSNEKALVKLGGMHVTDNLALTDRQRMHMAKQFEKVTIEEIARYQSDFLRGQKRTFTLHEHEDGEVVKIELKVPSIAEYLDAGSLWVNSIVTMVDKAFALPQSEDKRNDFIMQHGRATSMRQFSHWVNQIHLGDSFTDEPEEINNLLDTFSIEDDNVTKFVDEVKQYIQDSTISIVGVPTTKPGVPSTKQERFPHMIAIDALSVFFTLLLQTIRALEDRA
jgi:hypothetical protein